MPRRIDDRVRQNAGETYAKTDLTLQAIAKKFKVSDRTVQAWSVGDCWEAARIAHREANKSQNIVAFDANRPRENPRSIPRIKPDELPTIDLVNQAIADLYGDMAEAIGKDKAQIANALRGLLEYREKLQPQSVDDLANLVIDRLEKFGLSARDFAVRLKERQEERKRA